MGGAALQSADGDLQANREIVLAAVSKHGAALHFAAEYLQANREFVLAAVSKHGAALHFAAGDLWADHEVVLVAETQKQRGPTVDRNCADSLHSASTSVVLQLYLFTFLQIFIMCDLSPYWGDIFVYSGIMSFPFQHQMTLPLMRPWST